MALITSPFGTAGPGLGDGDFGDTWTWDGERWEEVASERSPPARFGHGMAYDATRERVVLFGGSRRDGSGALQELHDMSEGHPAGRTRGSVLSTRSGSTTAF